MVRGRVSPIVCDTIVDPDTGKEYQRTPKQKEFSQKFVENGFNGKRAAMEVYDTTESTAHVISVENLRKPPVELSIKEALIESGVTSDLLSKKIKQHVNSEKPGVSLKAIDLSLKARGDIVEKNETTHKHTLQVVSLSGLLDSTDSNNMLSAEIADSDEENKDDAS